ncbi:hypothetical protein STCU_08232 [Strigomonas culicis]|uniref:Leucine-rich repeat protein (LRRP) n=1 Tax=Strigomonas culicis TaxID=28005 RepID=S9U0E5_9TRYP|nr:hypothetical protein STCU_08232 [Strigomonas culicis]|eukprot:EPY22339.1 hypothetical protein STCU_08232 [Strigomonas culicis]
MGGTSSKERREAAAKTGILSLHDMDMRSWERLARKLEKVERARTLTLSGNRLSHPIPPSFLRLSVWRSLCSVDLSANGLCCACALGCGGTLPDGPPEVLPLEVLNLSQNRLRALPPLLCTRFPRLRKLVCQRAGAALELDGGLAAHLGASAALEVVDLSGCGLREALLIGEGWRGAERESPFPALRELLLAGNAIGGTFRLAPPSAVSQQRFPQLKRIVLDAPEAVLERVDPDVYRCATHINSLSLKGHTNEGALLDALRLSDTYKRWQIDHAEVVNRQAAGGRDVELIP